MSDNYITYREIKPHPLLYDYVKLYWHFQKTSTIACPFDIMPDGYFDLIVSFNYNGAMVVKLTGVWDKMVTVEHNYAETIGIRFKPLALYSLLDLRIGELLNSSSDVYLNDWHLNNELLQEKRSRSVDEIIQYLENCLIAMLNKERLDKRLKHLFELVDLSAGTMSVEHISDKIGLSTRQIHRRVTDLVGIGVKDYAKIVRFKKSLRLICEDKANFTGYFDQSHFIKDCKRYTGLTPNSMDLKNNVRFLQYYDFDNI